MRYNLRQIVRAPKWLPITLLFTILGDYHEIITTGVNCMRHLEIHLLGPFQVTLGRVPITNFGADTARALLAYLVWHAGVPMPRETLAELLWPEQPTDKALHALSQTLNRLRKALGEATAASPFLNLTRDTIEFNAQADYDLDVNAFTRLIVACQQHSHRNLEVCGSCQSRLEQAAALYRADLLSGFFLNSRSFEEWLVLQRELLQRQVIETFHALAAYHERHGRYERACHYAWRQIELEPWREAAQRQLMRSSALNGQRGTALMQYQRCRQILADELGVAPERETTRLYEQIQAEQLEPGTVLAHNLPAPLTTFVGRQTELAHISERINQPNDRLVTLVGPGGIGKTRLAVQAAQNEVGNFRDGVCFVSLAAVSASEFATSLAQALSFTFTGNQSPWLELFDYLREKDLLLVLDSFEHLLSEVEQIAELLRHAPHVRLLVSSRERLNIHGEWVMPLAGLPYPQDGGNEPLAEEAGEWAAMQLFEQSARRIRSDRPLDRSDAPAIKRICQFVDGLPLGLELAAVWSRVLACHEIATEIQRNVDFLQTSLHDVPERHRSLRAVFDHSWALLSSEEQLVFSRQAVFQGSFDRTATLAVTGASSAVLATLIDKSLLEPVTPMPGQGSHEASSQRYQLHSLLQHYAAERLAAAPAVEAETRDRHGRYYLAFLQRCLPDLKGSALRRALEAIGLEINNVRAAWKWAVAHKRSEELAPALEGLYLFYEAQGWFQEGEESFRRVVQALQDDHRSLGQIIVGRALACRGWFTFRQGRYAEARQLLEQSLTLLREQAALPAVAFTLNRLGEMAFLSGKYAEAQASCQESRRLCQTADDSAGLVTALVTLGRTACAQGSYAEAQHDSEEALTLARAAGLGHGTADSLRQMSNVAFALNRYDQAQDYLEQARQLYRELGLFLDEGIVLSKIGILAVLRCDYPTARTYLEQSLAIQQKMGNRRDRDRANVLNGLGTVLTYQGEYLLAKHHIEEALQIDREINARLAESMMLHNLGIVWMHLGSYEEAQTCLEQALDLRREIGYRLGEGLTLGELGRLFYQRGQPQVAHTYSQQALQIAQALGNQHNQAHAWLVLGHALTELDRLTEAITAYEQSLRLRQELAELHLGIEPQAGLARVFLKLANPAQALHHVEAIWRFLEQGPLIGLEEPLYVYLTCYQVLQASADPRAQRLLDIARRLLWERANRIDEEKLRRSFLENVPAHAAILQAGSVSSARSSDNPGFSTQERLYAPRRAA